MAKKLVKLIDKIEKANKVLDERDLMFLHNTNAEKLARQKNMGGMPMPSLAITKADIPMEGFGDITMVGKPEAFDPKASKTNKVYSADAYTARAPRPVRIAKKKAGKSFQEGIGKELKEMGYYTDELDSNIWDLQKKGDVDEHKYNQVENYFQRDNGANALFLKSQGIELPRHKEIAVGGKLLSDFELRGNALATYLEEGDSFKVAMKKSRAIAEKAKERNPGLSERKHELLDNLEKAVGKNTKVEKVPGEINNAELYDLVKPLEKEKKAWADERINEIFEADEFFITNPNRDRYAQKTKLKPYTADDVTAYMKKQGGRGAEGGMQSKTAGGVRAYTTEDLKSLAEIRKRKDALVTSEDMAEFKVTSDNMLDDLQKAFKRYYEYDSDGWHYTDEFREMVQKTETQGVQSALKEIGFKDVPEDLVQELNDYKDMLRSGVTEYFEAKPARSVQFDEFGGAIVPNDTDPDTIKMLQEQGLEVRKYSTEEERTEARKEFSKYMFQMAPVAAVGTLAAASVVAPRTSEASTLGTFEKIRKAALKANLDPEKITLKDTGEIEYPEEYIDPLTTAGAGDVRREVAINNDQVLGTDTKAEYDQKALHGTGNLEDIAERGFDPKFTGKGADQYGSGFYTTNKGNTASGYTEYRSEADLEKLGGESSPGVFVGRARFENPLEINANKYGNLDQALELSAEQVRKMLDDSPALKRAADDDEMNPAGDHYESFWSSGEVEEWMLDDLAEKYAGNNATGIEMELFDNDAEAFRGALAKATGHDGVVVNFPDTGEVHSIAWKPEQLRAETAAFDPQFKKSSNLLGNVDPEAIKMLAAGGTAAAAAPIAGSYLSGPAEPEGSKESREALTAVFDYAKKRAGRDFKDADQAKKFVSMAESSMADHLIGTGQVAATIGSTYLNEAAGGLGAMGAEFLENLADGFDRHGAEGIADAVRPDMSSTEMVGFMSEDAPIYTPTTKEGQEQLRAMGEILGETADYWTKGQGGQAIKRQLDKSELTRGFNPVANFNESVENVYQAGSKLHPKAGAMGATILRMLPELL